MKDSWNAEKDIRNEENILNGVDNLCQKDDLQDIKIWYKKDLRNPNLSSLFFISIILQKERILKTGKAISLMLYCISLKKKGGGIALEKELLKYGVVYGANAAGKTNLVDFFRFFKECVSKGIPMESTGMFCKNREENKERESSFEVQITVADKFYAYGFSAILSKRKVTAEWLYELYQNGTARCMFEREGNKSPELDESITLSNTKKINLKSTQMILKATKHLCF